MRLNIVYKAEAPEPPYSCEFVNIDTEAVPFMLYGLWLKAQKYFWATTDDWRVGRWLMNKEGAALLMPCGQDIVNAIDRLYVLQAAAQMGITYFVSGTGTEADPYIYDPPLVQAQEPIIGELPGLLSLQVDQIEAWRNWLNGAPSTNYPDTRNIRQQLEDILAALAGSGFDDTEILADLAEIIVLLGV